jgi:hypothetical protein
MNHPKPWLRYVDANQVDDKTLDIDGMKVTNDVGDKLGEVDGLIVDANTGRTYYIAVDAGGWFKSRQFLLPIGETRLDADRDALVVALPKDQVGRFPGFDKDEFDTLTEVDIKRINDETYSVFDVTFSHRQTSRTPPRGTVRPIGTLTGGRMWRRRHPFLTPAES